VSRLVQKGDFAERKTERLPEIQMPVLLVHRNLPFLFRGVKTRISLILQRNSGGNIRFHRYINSSGSFSRASLHSHWM